MNTLLSISIDSTVTVLLGTLTTLAVAAAFLMWRSRLLLPTAWRSIPRLQARSMLIASGWMFAVVIIATVLAGCGKGGH